MQSRIDSESTPDHDPARSRPEQVRRRYRAPALDHLGPWSALTLQQSVPITPVFDLQSNDVP